MDSRAKRGLAWIGLTGVLLALAACGGSSSSVNNPNGQNNLPPVIVAINVTPSGDIRIGQTQTVQFTVRATDPEFPNTVNGSSLAVNWSQVSGPVVELSNANSFTTSFAVPSEQDIANDPVITLAVVVSDASQQATDQISVTILPPASSTAPLVDAGPDQVVNSGDVVDLMGTASDPDGAIASVQWEQVANGAPLVILNTPSGGDGSAVSFTAPQTTVELDLLFEFSATDNAPTPNTSMDQLSVKVLPLPAARGPTNLYVSTDGPNALPDATLMKLTESVPASMLYTVDRNFDSAYNQGLVIDVQGNAIQVGDHQDDDYGGISTICRIANRADNTAFADDTLDRDIRGEEELDFDPNVFVRVNNPGLNRGAIKGLAISHATGHLMLANNAGSHVRVFGATAEGNIGADFAVTLGADPWDLAYDAARDILYVAAVNGTIRVLDSFLDQRGALRETRVIRINDPVVGAATNLHGIAYEPVGDRLVVSDVGAATTANGSAAGFKTDGKLYVLTDASTLDGTVAPQIVLSGPQTQLGDPVDLVINGRDVLVADKANDVVLIFADIFQQSSGDPAPTRVIPGIVGANALALEFLDQPARPGVTDLVANTTVHSLLLTVDDGAAPNIVRLNPALGAQDEPDRFVITDGRPKPYGITLDRSGDAYVVAETPSNGPSRATAGIYAISRLAYDRTAPFATPGGFSDRRDRELDDAADSFPANSPIMQSPRGIDIDPAAGLLFIAEATPGSNNLFEVVVMSACSAGEPLAAVTVPSFNNSGPVTNVAVPIGLDYDPGTGDLYVAMANGKLAIFRDFNVRYPDNPAPQIVSPQRFNDLTGLAEDAATSLSGVEYDGASKSLILSGIGPIDATTSGGQIFILRGADNLGSTKLVDLAIRGGQSLLANPVDVAFDGQNLYVVEQAGGLILRFDNILSVTDGSAATPSAMTSTASFGGTPRGLVIVPDYLAQTPANP